MKWNINKTVVLKYYFVSYEVYVIIYVYIWISNISILLRKIPHFQTRVQTKTEQTIQATKNSPVLNFIFLSKYKIGNLCYLFKQNHSPQRIWPIGFVGSLHFQFISYEWFTISKCYWVNVVLPDGLTEINIRNLHNNVIILGVVFDLHYVQCAFQD